MKYSILPMMEAIAAETEILMIGFFIAQKWLVFANCRSM
jgi:hypothetical protein